MGAGLTIYNDRLNLQIGADYQNLSLKTTIKIPLKTDPYPPKPDGSPLHPLDTWADSDIFALQPIPNVEYQSIYRTARGGYIHVFEDIPQTASPSGLGLEVYRPDGSVSYSSKYRSINVIDYVKTRLTYINGQNDFFSKNYGTTDIAVIPLISPIGFSLVGTTGYVGIWGLCFQISTTGLLEASMRGIGGMSGIEAQNMHRESYKVEFLVIDTSKY